MLFQRLALRVSRSMRSTDRGQALLITSARAGEGKSHIAESLARALSQQALGDVVLVDCAPSAQSSRSPVRLPVTTQATRFIAGAGVSRAGDLDIHVTVSGQVAPGVYGQVQLGSGQPPPVVYAQPTLCHLINVDASRMAQTTFESTDSLKRLPFGNGDETTLYRAAGVARALSFLRGRFAFVILDGPPLTDCGRLTECADASLLVINASRTRREIVKGGLQASGLATHNLLGAVLNERPQYVPRWLYRRAL